MQLDHATLGSDSGQHVGAGWRGSSFSTIHPAFFGLSRPVGSETLTTPRAINPFACMRMPIPFFSWAIFGIFLLGDYPLVIPLLGA
jgi:hypothetical protein